MIILFETTSEIIVINRKINIGYDPRKYSAFFTRGFELINMIFFVKNSYVFPIGGLMVHTSFSYSVFDLINL